jgi:hypothetical protein
VEFETFFQAKETTKTRLGSLDAGLGVKFQEVVHAKESWDTWVNEDPKHPTTSNA